MLAISAAIGVATLAAVGYLAATGGDQRVASSAAPQVTYAGSSVTAGSQQEFCATGQVYWDLWWEYEHALESNISPEDFRRVFESWRGAAVRLQAAAPDAAVRADVGALIDEIDALGRVLNDLGWHSGNEDGNANPINRAAPEVAEEKVLNHLSAGCGISYD